MRRSPLTRWLLVATALFLAFVVVVTVFAPGDAELWRESERALNVDAGRPAR